MQHRITSFHYFILLMLFHRFNLPSVVSVNITSYLKSYDELLSLSALVLLTNIYSLFQLLSNLYIVLKLTVYLSLLVN